MTTNWSNDLVVDAMGRSSDFTAKCLMALFTRQDMDEKEIGDSKYKNDRGFNKWDARFLTHWAKRVVKGEQLPTDKAAIVRAKIAKYKKQLVFLSSLLQTEGTKS